ncbi:MAG TPA: ABC transporter ATP-binding protein [Chloroflexota bacterium]|nr:ABC transporter ATP-binding protein [Chloroflexota bacterium]
MLEVQGLVAGYQRTKIVLRDVSLSFPAGELAVIMGHNGAGKTTLLNAIFGVLQPEQGAVLFKGQEMRGGPEERVRRGISYSMAGQAILPGLTVADNLETASAVFPTDATTRKIRRDSVFDLFPILADRQRQRAGTLSGGQQRMLSIGMALMRGPEVLLLDEPSLGLSPLLVESLYNVIARVRRELGMTIVVVEQSLDPGLLQADKLHILRMGKVVFSGDSAVLFDKQKLWNLL